MQQRTEKSPDTLADARQVEQLWRYGPRPIYQFLVELGAERMVRTPIETKLTRYIERLSPAKLAPISGDRMPPVPIHRVP